uniref:Uncharacterized protein n=1 Tax=Ascaris lumbricoides TaxID=6252 RepID=A0A0M3HKI8_ASCLU
MINSENDRVDFYVGAMLEDPVVRGLIGPTLACIVGPQFQRSRDGDRSAVILLRYLHTTLRGRIREKRELFFHANSF